jgi:CheY-like chemotaxis protein
MTERCKKERARVLVVEDEAMLAMMLEDMLAELGHEVVASAGSMEQAEALIRRGGFDLAVLDVNLDGRHSFPLAELLEARGVPFLFATGYGRGGLPEPWNEAPVLQKPFSQHELQQLMATLR